MAYGPNFVMHLPLKDRGLHLVGTPTFHWCTLQGVVGNEMPLEF